VVTWRRARMVLRSAQNMDVSGIAKAAFTSEDDARNHQAKYRGLSNHDP